MTSEQITANRKSAGNLVRYQLGLDLIAESDWTYEQRTAFNKSLAAYIAAHPNAFAASDLVTAQQVTTNQYTPLQDSSFDAGEFLSTTAANAAAPFQAIGDGIITTANAARWVIPLFAAGAVVLLLLALNKKVGGSAKLAAL